MDTAFIENSNAGRTSASEEEIQLLDKIRAGQNVRYTFFIQFFFVLASCIAFGPAFDKFLYILAEGENKIVGTAESVSGLASLVVVLPVAYLVDSRPRERAGLVHKAAYLGIFSVVFFCYAVLANSIKWLFLGLALEGLFYELYGSASAALFADSAILVSNRKDLYVKKSILETIGMGFGPLLSIVLIYVRAHFRHHDQDQHAAGQQLGNKFLGNVVSDDSLLVSQSESTSSLSSTLHLLRFMHLSGRGGRFFLPFLPSLLLDTAQKNSSVINAPSTPDASITVLTDDIKIVGGDEDHWGIPLIHTVLLVGASAFVPAIFFAFKFQNLEQIVTDDGNESDGDSEEARSHAGDMSPRTRELERTSRTSGIVALADDHNMADIGLRENESAGSFKLDVLSSGSDQDNQNATTNNNEYPMAQVVTEDTQTAAPRPNNPPMSRKRRWRRAIPFLLAFSDFITAVGAGMTVKFFNLFFIEDYKFTEVQILLVQMCYPWCIGACTWVVGKVADCIGRAQTSFLSLAMGALCTYLMSYTESIVPVLLVFMLRGGLCNAVAPIDQSIQMDYTPSSERGRWSALESLSSMTWSGSAVIGGFIADASDYRFTFKITALVYALAVLSYTPLLWLVPRRRKKTRSS